MNNSELIYTISNSSMKFYPENVRTKYSNKLSKYISTTIPGHNFLLISLESITFENSIIQYENTNIPDIISFSNTGENIHHPNILYVSENMHLSNESFIDQFKHETNSLFLKDAYLTNGYIELATNTWYTLISPRLYRFLGFTDFNGLITINPKKDDVPNLEKYDTIFYVIDKFGEGNHLTADQKFDLNIYMPNLIKISCDNLDQYLCGGGFRNILALIPFDHSKRALTFTPAVRQQFKTNTDFLSTISMQLIDEKDNPIKFLPGSPTIVKIRVNEMMGNRDTFYVRLSNVDSLNIYSENTQSNFKCKLPKVLNFAGNWEVALANIYFPPKIRNIYHPMNVLTIEVSHTTQDFNLNISATIPSNRYSNTDDLIIAINKSLENTSIRFKKVNENIMVFSEDKENAFFSV